MSAQMAQSEELLDKRRKIIGLSLLSLLLSTVSLASTASVYHDKQFHFNTGLVTTSFRGENVSENTAIVNSFSVPTAFNLEFEMATNNRRSIYVHGAVAYTLSQLGSIRAGKIPYMGFGAGYRFYLGSASMGYELIEGAQQIRQIPKWRYYIGPELNIAQIILIESTRVLTTSPVILEIGGCGGLTYQLNRTMGINFQVGTTFGMSLTTISMAGFVQRFQGGLAYTF